MTPGEKKVAVVVGAAAAAGLVILLWPKKADAKALPPKDNLTANWPPPKTPHGLNFETRNINALNAVVDKMIADPNIAARNLKSFADSLAYYGLVEQAQKLSQRAATLPKYTQHEIESGAAALWEQQARQGVW